MTAATPSRLSLIGAILAAAGIASNVFAQGPAATNLAPNPSFEEPPASEARYPTGWDFFHSHIRRISLTNGVAAEGRQSLRISAQESENASQGTMFRREVKKGERYTFRAKFSESPDHRLKNAHAVLVVEWKNGAGREISRVASTRLDAGTLSPGKWRGLELKRVPVPPDAKEAVFGVHLVETRGSRGTLLVDEVELYVDD